MRYPGFGDFCDVAADILGIEPEQVARLPNTHLAESALDAPQTGFGDLELYPGLLEKAAVLLERLARNHPLPDGNKRTALTLTGLFLEMNGRPLVGADLDRDVHMVERVASGEAERDEVVRWLEERTGISGPS